MSEQTSTEAEVPVGARAVAQYVGHDTEEPEAERSLPGYLGAVPSIVKVGTPFTFDASFAAELEASGEFEVHGLLDLDVEGDRELRDKIEEEVTARTGAVVPAELAEADEAAAKAAAEAEADKVDPPTPPTPPGNSRGSSSSSSSTTTPPTAPADGTDTPGADGSGAPQE